MSSTIERVQIGDCTLYHGDCREVLPTLAPGSVDSVVTDPPYGHNNNNNGDLIHRWEAALGRGESPQEAARPIANDGAEADTLFRDVLPACFGSMKPGACCCFCCSGGGPDTHFARWSLWIDEVFDFKQMVVWDKGPIGMGWHYRRSYETVLVAQKPGAACKWHTDDSDIENIIRPGDYGIRKIIPKKDDHPTPKPVELAEHFARLHTVQGDTVLDPFMGAGWVAEACVRIGRKFVGVEIDRVWFDRACERIEKAYADKSAPLYGDNAPARKTEQLVLGAA